jgi:hypothetical protein
MVLFTCSICNYGHTSLNVETFRDCASGQTIYLCKTHISNRTPRMIHIPWLDDDVWTGCNVCDPSDHCYGLDHPDITVHGTGKNFCISRKDKAKISKVISSSSASS